MVLPFLQMRTACLFYASYQRWLHLTSSQVVAAKKHPSFKSDCLAIGNFLQIDRDSLRIPNFSMIDTTIFIDVARLQVTGRQYTSGL